VNISAPAKTEGTVLVADDANIMRATCRRALERFGYQVRAAESGEEAIKLLQEKPAEVAVLDIRMPGISGMELLKEIKTRWPATEVVMMTAFADTAVAEESLHLGATAFLIKPFEHITILLDTVKKCMSRVRIRRGEIAEDGPRFEEILRLSGLVTEEQFAQARAIAKKEGLTLRQALTAIKVLAP
jgi:DNA-binding NtrC family response regulator